MVLDTNFFEFNDKEYLQQDGIGKTQNAVYSIDCEKRGHIVYVGETGTSLYERFQNTIQYNENLYAAPSNPNKFSSAGKESLTLL